jgi:geranylgeranyl pyrophosphate synthase
MVAVTAELCHTGALIVDDIEDGSATRRGDEAIHLRYGTEIAINAANTLYFLPHLLYADHPHLSSSQRLKAHQSMVQQMVKAHLGQGMDIFWSRNLSEESFEQWAADGLADKVLQMYAFKTGAALEGLADLACTITSSRNETRLACVELARTFGVSFQIIDDVLDFDGSPSSAKPVGRDLAAGKLTFVLVRALDMLWASQRRRLLRILCRRDVHPIAVAEAIGLVRVSGALEECRRTASKCFEEAWSEYSRLVPDSDAKAALGRLCRHLVEAPGAA